jgi:hypothetical protein
MNADDTATLIATRVPELNRAELVLIESALAGDVVPVAALDDILTVIEALENRLNAYAEALGGLCPTSS